MSMLDVHACSAVSKTAYSKKIPHTIHIRGPTIEMDEGPQGPGTKGVKSGTVPAIQGPLRPMHQEQIQNFERPKRATPP